MAKWTASDVPPQDGRRIIVTGANSGIGKEAARELARAGARVTLAVRDTAKGEQAAAEMTGDVEVAALDLSDLESVVTFAGRVEGAIDVLVNNAGVMAPPLKRTAQGFELQLGTNHLGHFALTGLLLDRLLASGDGRVVTVSSFGHRMGKIKFDDLQSERGYQRWLAYGQSKLANLLFTFELQRLAAAADAPLRALACHPGYSSTNLGNHTESFQDKIIGLGNRLIAQDARAGAWPTLYATTIDLPGGAYVGPDGPGEMRGHPKLVGTSSAARDDATARRLWEDSERLTGVSYDFAVPATA